MVFQETSGLFFLTALIFSKADLINGKQEIYLGSHNYKEE